MANGSASENTPRKSFWDTTLGTITKVTALITAVTGLIVAIQPILKLLNLSPDAEKTSNSPSSNRNPGVSDTLVSANEAILAVLGTPTSEPEYLARMADLKSSIFPKVRYVANNNIVENVNSFANGITLYPYLKTTLTRLEKWDKKYLADYSIWKTNLYWSSDDSLTIHPVNVQGFNYQELLDSIVNIRNVIQTNARVINDLPESYFSSCFKSYTKEELSNIITRLAEYELLKQNALLDLKSTVESFPSERMIKVYNSKKISHIKIFLFNTLAIDPNFDFDYQIRRLKYANSEYETWIRSTLTSLQSLIAVEIENQK